jgi:hypothetical protein
MEEVEFLFDTQLINKLTELISGAKSKLLLISPYIDLDARIMDVLNEKISKPNIEIYVLFGKNEGNYLKSFKRDSINFLMQFPNIEIRYNERLHAKFYLNEFEYIMTSLNLYDYSLANNIEVGVYQKYSFEGLLGQALENGFAPIANGVNSAKQAVFGKNKITNPLEKFDHIFESSELKYKTKPILVEKSGVQGLIGMKQLAGFDILVNELQANTKTKTVSTTNLHATQSAPPQKPATRVEIKDRNSCVSASQLVKILGVKQYEITNLMERKGFISGERITELGISKGLFLKTYMGKEYIVYPENLIEFNELKNKTCP